MADPVYQDQPYMRKSFLFFSDVYLTGAVQDLHSGPFFCAFCATGQEAAFSQKQKNSR